MTAEPLLEGMAQTCGDRPEPLLRAGNTNCGGCGMSIGLNFLSRALAQRPAQIVIPACCGIVTAGAYPNSAYGAPVIASTFASAAAIASGLTRTAKMNGEKTRVICWAGDGGTFDIGMATLSAAAERQEDVLYICYDNEIYGNTGGQRSSATPMGAATTTTPKGKALVKKDILAIMAAHGVAYAASVSLAHADDTMRKMRHALETEGFRFLHILSPCPTGWKSEPSEGIELIRLAVKSGLYPVMEYGPDGDATVNVEPTMDDAALKSYFEKQGRFRKAQLDFESVRASIDTHWKRIRSQVR